MYKIYDQYCKGLKAKQKYRKLPELIDHIGRLLDFSKNDYLNLANSKHLKKAAKKACDKFGIGSTGSRLLSGNRKIFENLESMIAKDKSTESALILNSGFQANITVLPSLLDKHVLKTQAIVFFDQLNHSSLYQGIFLSQAKLIRYRHNDMKHLYQLLDEYKDDPKPKFIVTVTLFSMDGDLANLKKIAELAKEYNVFLYLDEAHATGLIGRNGYGLSTTVDLSKIPHLIMGTFSEALGCFGAYVACSTEIKNYLINKCTGFIYSTALPPMIIEAVFTAWDLVRHLDQERKNLSHLAERCRKKLQSLHFDTGKSETNIIPIILQDEEIALRIKKRLYEKSILVSAIRPPTVPLGTSRLRISLTIQHSENDVENLVNALNGCKNE